ncbi:JmjC domain-containing histone demethylation protein 1, partial [Coniosporium uncinatum]
VRKSSRAHTAVDYAGLHEGVLRTSDEDVEHHYIKSFKDGSFTFLPENFPRMPPELVTAEYFERCKAMTEPVVIPASLNPRPKVPGTQEDMPGPTRTVSPGFVPQPDGMLGESSEQSGFEYELAEDVGQDKLGMVIPQGLTVPRVAELYGPEEKVEVIDVKSQEGEDKRWNMRKWADYYESTAEDKKVRNVISLEVSRSKLGRLIRRPQVVRDLDLQDSVWPKDLENAPKVQFYCLMSVADCYTDFHIDFGGSSVYYHILKGKKTFFFIPPKKQHLKKYEEWCLSPAQNWTFLGDQTNECYRVDLSAGDTMLIPSGWIHSVWTPENSLVIGGNFLTRLHFGTQIKVLEIEKATKVPLKFRYPYFQKLMWFTAIKYLEDDAIPASVVKAFYEGKQFQREKPIWMEPNKFGHNSDPGQEHWNARYYPQAELEGLQELANYLFRTVLISQGRIEGITVEQKNAVKRSIPRSHGEPLDVVKRFA